MPPIIALALSAVLIGVLLRIERRRDPFASAALWLPTCWMLIAASRPLGRWLGGVDLNDADGSPEDRIGLAAFLIIAILIVLRRTINWSRLLLDNRWVFLLFLYLALSALWADHPFISIKRVVRSAGPMLMALVVLSEQRPLEALASIFRRCAYVLIPLSIVLIRYYPEMGRAYHVWTGVEMWTGVATHKNGLGQLCAISAFFLIWSLGLGKANEVRASPIQRMADVSVLLMACYLLIGPGQGAYSATSLGILAAGVGTLLTLRCTPRVATALATHGGVLVITLVLGYALLGDVVTATVSALFGRDGNLTGRTVEIWPYAWEIGARHPILGAGYGGVWGLGGDISLKTGVEQAHNGYLDVYLELGIVGLLFLGAYFLNLCGTVRRAFRCDVNWGLFGLCFVLMTLIYNISETAFFDVYLGASMLLVTMTLSVAAAPGVATAGVRRQSVPAFTGCDVRGNSEGIYGVTHPFRVASRGLQAPQPTLHRRRARGHVAPEAFAHPDQRT